MEKARITDVVIAMATVVIAVATVVQGYELVTGSRDTHDLAVAALAANRAWIAPEQMVLGSPVEAGLPVKYQIRIVNSGKSPALGIVWNVKPYGFPYIPAGSEPSLNWAPNATCTGLKPTPIDGLVLYPQGPMNYLVPMTIPDTPENRELIKEVITKTKSLIIEGCFAYSTTNAEHTSSFRFFLRDIPGPSFTKDKDGIPVPAWNFNAALTGDEAN